MRLRSKLQAGIVSVLQTVTAGCVYEMAYGQMKIKRKGGLGFIKRVMRNSTPGEDFLSAIDLEGKTIYDIGGYIGLSTVFFAKSTGPTGQVVVFEPNKDNCSRIEEHLRLNDVGNVRLLAIGIGNKKERRVFVVRQHRSATGSMEERIQSQIITEGDFRQLEVDVDTLDSAISAHDLPKPDFVNIDIEGMEFNALLGASQTVQDCSPHFFVEIHGADESTKVENIHRILELLLSWEYSVWHVESKQNITIRNHRIAKEGHIFCRRP